MLKKYLFVGSLSLCLALMSLSGCALKHKREADADKIVEAYKLQKEQVKNCYYKALETQPKLQGEVVLSWIVSGRGELKEAWIKNSTLNDSDMETCILNHLKTVQFPKTQNMAKITVEYTLTFGR